MLVNFGTYTAQSLFKDTPMEVKFYHAINMLVNFGT